MKQIHKLLALVIIALLTVSACDTDELAERNIDPYASNEIDPRYVLSYAQLHTCESRYVNWRNGLIINGTLIQIFGAGGYAWGDKYEAGIPDHMAAYFDYVYQNGMKDAGEAMRLTHPETGDKPQFVNTHQAARIVYAFGAHRMTDLYGNVPYFQANRGIEGADYFFPVFDDQEQIYTREGIGEGELRGGLLWELDDAASKITETADDISAADMIYNGDLAKWRKFAYSLMLRLAMRVYEKDPATATTYVNRAIAGGLMESNDDDCWIPMAVGDDIWLNQNGWSRAMDPYDGSGGFYLSETFIDWMMGNNDPRLMIFSGGIGTYDDCRDNAPGCNKTPADQLGRPNGHDGDTMKEWCQLDPRCGGDGVTPVVDEFTFSRPNYDLLDKDEPYLWMTYSEVELLLAECAVRGIGNVSGSAASHYDAGVRAAMQRWVLHDPSFVVDDATVDAYLAAHPLAGTESEQLDMIGHQYWAATFLNFFETYSNWRRSGYPTLIPAPHEYPGGGTDWYPYTGNVSNGQIFRRVKYPSSEAAINPNFSSTATTPDDWMTQMWWDVGNGKQ